jgi:hypothetical protein
MKSPGKTRDDATTARVLGAGFQVVAEYDHLGRLVNARGRLNRGTWIRAAEIARSRSGVEAEQKATAMLLSDIFIGGLDLQGGGTLLAIIERPVAEAAADQLTSRLDSALGDYIGPVPAPLAVLAGVIILAFIVLGGGASK